MSLRGELVELESQRWLQMYNGALFSLRSQPEASSVVLGVVEEPAHAVPLLQGLGEHDVEARVVLGIGLVVQWRSGGWPLYEEELREEVNEGFPDPGRHLVSCRGPKIDIENTLTGE